MLLKSKNKFYTNPNNKMKKTLLITLLLFSFIGFSQNTITCTIKTSLGDIQMELYGDKAPITVSNFLNYVNNKLYDNANFFRVCTNENEADRTIKIEVVQGGDIPVENLFEPIELEPTEQTKILHKNGTVSMARDEPNTAQSSFFICINDQPNLDFGGKRNPDGLGFAAFGKVTDGMEVVLKIQSGQNKNQVLISPIIIYSIRRNN